MYINRNKVVSLKQIRWTQLDLKQLIRFALRFATLRGLNVAICWNINDHLTPRWLLHFTHICVLRPHFLFHLLRPRLWSRRCFPWCRHRRIEAQWRNAWDTRNCFRLFCIRSVWYITRLFVQIFYW